jgi:hypothetical protein
VQRDRQLDRAEVRRQMPPVCATECSRNVRSSSASWRSFARGSARSAADR